MHIDSFLTWFDSTGVDTTRVRVRHTGESGFGLYSHGVTIEKDALVLAIPERLFIKPSVQTEELTGFEQLIVQLIETKHDPYVHFLRSMSCVPPWRHLPDERFPRQLADPMMKHRTKYEQSRAKLSQYEDEEFQWAYYAINTRCVHLDLDRGSTEPDENLCLIPYLGSRPSLISTPASSFRLDFVNHSVQPNTLSQFNPDTHCYEIRATRRISANEQITFLYNPHSNVDLFIEYGFVLPDNPHNQLNLDYELERVLSKQQMQTMKSFHYWNSLQFYPGDNDLSWTVIKAIELNVNEAQWSPYDDAPLELRETLSSRMHAFRTVVQRNLDDDFQRWLTERFIAEKTLLYQDFTTILCDTSVMIDKSFPLTYCSLLFLHLIITTFTVDQSFEVERVKVQSPTRDSLPLASSFTRATPISLSLSSLLQP